MGMTKKPQKGLMQAFKFWLTFLTKGIRCHFAPADPLYLLVIPASLDIAVFLLLLLVYLGAAIETSKAIQNEKHEPLSMTRCKYLLVNTSLQLHIREWETEDQCLKSSLTKGRNNNVFHCSGTHKHKHGKKAKMLLKLAHIPSLNKQCI